MATRNLGKYRLLAELGQGGMADVYLAVASQGVAYFAKLVVIKRLREQFARDAEFMTMFVDEARIAARLNHPNLVQTLEVGEAGGQHFLTMEYLDGQPLHRILNRGRTQFPQNLYLSVLVDVLEGIHHAHELRDFDGSPLNIVHRDVTPHNVFVVYEGIVKVVDFGIAKAAGRISETRHGVIKGKVAYMAPEQAVGGAIDRRVDVFAVGVMLFEAITGARMWKGLKETDIIRRLVAGKIPSPREIDPNVDRGLERICTRALAVDPEGRYATAADFAADLLAYLYSQGPRPGSREVGAFVSQLFADKREVTSKIIESQLANLRTETTGGPLVAFPQATQTLHTVAPAMARESNPDLGTPSSSSLSVPIKPATPVPAATRGVQGERRLAYLVMAGLALFALLVALVVVSLVRPGRDDEVVSSEKPITIRLRATPLETRFSIDDGPLLENPFVGTYPRDRRRHRIVATAPGCAPKEQPVEFDDDLSIRFTLGPDKFRGVVGPSAVDPR